MLMWLLYSYCTICAHYYVYYVYYSVPYNGQCAFCELVAVCVYAV